MKYAQANMVVRVRVSHLAAGGCGHNVGAKLFLNGRQCLFPKVHSSRWFFLADKLVYNFTCMSAKDLQVVNGQHQDTYVDVGV